MQPRKVEKLDTLRVDQRKRLGVNLALAALAMTRRRLKAALDNKDNAPWPGFAVINAAQLGVEKNALLSPRKCCNMPQQAVCL